MLGSGAGQVATHGSLLLALPLSAAAGAVSFFSPCSLPLVPAFGAYVTGVQARADTGRPSRRASMVAALLFTLGFGVLFVSYGALFGGAGAALTAHQRVLETFLGLVTIVVATSFFPIGRRILPWHRSLMVHPRPTHTPRSLWAAPALGLMSGLGWTPCIGPTLAGVLSLAAVSGTAVRGSVLAASYAAGLGIPFVVLGFLGDRVLSIVRRWPRAMSFVAAGASLCLVVIGVLEVTGVWSRLLVHLQTLVSATQLPL